MVKFKHSSVGLRKPSLIICWTLFLTLFVTFTFLILIILTLRIPKPNHLNSITHSNTLRNEDDDNKRWVQIISWEPRAFLYHNFLTKEECEHLINIAKPSMHKSAVIDEETGNGVDSRERTSSGAFLKRGSDRIVKNIERRIADFTFIPVEHGENFNVLHYEVGQKYEPHYDYFMDTFSTTYAGQRIATMLMYLSDVEEGGETVFPNAKGNFSSVPWWNELSDCGKGGLSIKPKMGNAILFWSMKPDATLDPSSLHGACPVIKGDKWLCAKWMHVGEFKI
ncbi:putative procollagen-proline dioxygenase [Medicago truncatula]|uniref:procollagen-proline 4-dioxygenase n=1 Tax=Medicago truncatula TaxID=3880 RepID=A0A396GN32_MEDTR|nr:probable prolyl 4-hydroxylase 10 [Medicago truncatula]RHN41923.1 putative procollagen-proline dioxygenase [Medicago truncatula]